MVWFELQRSIRAGDTQTLKTILEKLLIIFVADGRTKQIPIIAKKIGYARPSHTSIEGVVITWIGPVLSVQQQF